MGTKGHFEKLILEYQTAFRDRYGRSPLELPEDSRSKGWGILKRLGTNGVFDINLTCEVVRHYLSIDGVGDSNWFRVQGHSIDCLSQNLEQVYADYLSKAGSAVSRKTYWVNGVTQSGFFIVEEKPRQIHNRFKPIKFDEWKRLSPQGKCQNLSDDPEYGFFISNVEATLREQFTADELR